MNNRIGVVIVACCVAAPVVSAQAGELWNSPTYQAGLEVWRQADAFGNACMNCHGPDAFDLAYIDFSDETIRRRAAPHVSPEDGEKIVALVHEIRAAYGITQPKDPFGFRPFQPGSGVPIAGDTWAERDANFLAYLRSIDFPLTDPDVTIDTIPEARAAFESLYAIDPRTIDIGLPLNRWSEDIHHGIEHGTLADWVSDLPRLPVDEAARDELFALQDVYLQNPTQVNLFAYYDRLGDLTVRADDHGSGKLSSNKYRSVQIASHLFREDAAGEAGFLGLSRMAFDEPELPYFYTDRVFLDKVPNPMWEVGDRARIDEGTSKLGVIGEYPYPSFVLDRLRDDWSERDHTDAIRVPWFFTGWLFNPTLQRISGSNSTKSGEYFSHFGVEDYESDMMSHVMYYMMLLKVNHRMEPRAISKVSHLGRESRGWSPPMSNFTRMLAPRYYAGRRIADGQHGNRIDFIDDQHEQAFLHFSTNAHRMLLLAFKEDLRLYGPNFTSKDPTDRGWVWFMNFLREADTPHSELNERIYQKIVRVRADGNYCEADVTADGVVGVRDFVEVLVHYGDETDLGDADSNGRVDVVDFIRVLLNFGRDCSDPLN